MKKSNFNTSLREIEEGELDAYEELDGGLFPRRGVWLTRKAVFEEIFWRQWKVVRLDKTIRSIEKSIKYFNTAVDKALAEQQPILRHMMWLRHQLQIEKDGWSLGFAAKTEDEILYEIYLLEVQDEQIIDRLCTLFNDESDAQYMKKYWAALVTKYVNGEVVNYPLSN